MKNHILKYCSRTGLISLEILAILIGILVLAGGLFIWRLTTGPFNIDFARNYIEQALSDPVSGYNVDLEGIYISWPDLRGPVQLKLDDIKLIREQQIVLDIDRVGIGLSTPHLLIGRIVPIGIKLTSPVLHLVRTEENQLHFGVAGQDMTTLVEEGGPGPEDDEGGPLMRIINALTQAPGARASSSPIRRLESVEIDDARMVVEDHHLGITWFVPHIDLAFARSDAGLMASVRMDMPGGRDGAGHVQADMVYHQDLEQIALNMNVQDFNPHTISRKIGALDFLNQHYTILNGNISARMDMDFTLNSAALSLASSHGYLGLYGIYDQPFPYESLSLEAAYDRTDKQITLSEASITAQGVTVSAQTQAHLDDHSFHAPMRLHIAELAQAQIKPLWPDMLRGEGAEIWLTERLSNGRMHDAAVHFDLKGWRTQVQDSVYGPEPETTAQEAVPQEAVPQEAEWQLSVEDVVADFVIKDMDIDYRAPLPPALGASGTGRYEDDILDIQIDSARLETMSVESGRVLLRDVSDAQLGTAEITMDLAGELPAVFRYVAHEPIEMDSARTGIDPDTVKGQARLHINVSFPLLMELEVEQVVVTAEGELRNVRLPGIVRGMDLAEADLRVRIADGAVDLAGRGKLDGRDVTLSWRQFIDPEGRPYESKLAAQLVADPRLRAIFGIGLEDWLAGNVPVDLTYTEFQDGRSEVDVTADLTPARVMVAPFEYIKPPGQSGQARLTGYLQGGDLRRIEGVHVTTPELALHNARFIFEGDSILRRGTIPRATLGENDLALDFEIGPGDLMKMDVEAAFFDARPFMARKKDAAPYDGPPVIATVEARRMRVLEGRTLNDARVYVDRNHQGDIDRFEMDAISGEGSVYVRLHPNETGRMALHLDAADAGAFLRDFGIYDNVRGGRFIIRGAAASLQERHILRGQAELTDFRVVNAPVLARLVNTISMAGIPQLLGGEGISFARLESDFTWHIRHQGDLYEIHDGRTSGSAMGLTFDGLIDRSEEYIDLSGTIVPVSMINELLANIPLIGAILGGGSSAVFAATYTVRGPTDNPVVSVNPLSVLAPGIIRRILFEN